MASLLKSAFLCIGFLASFAAAAQTINVGSQLAEIKLEDQFEQSLSLTSETQYLLFSRDMKGGEVVQLALEQHENNDAVDIIYLADISKMPGLISRFIAVPRMKDYPFSVGLDREGDATSNLPSNKDVATLVTLDNLTVKSIQFIDDADALAKLLR
ncbi:hypothetical protein [Shewanella maritima]|uniref:hypothetical protein n=1 Tax=Shewanella maritima TaxID=2520507 RepID=UPI003736D108